MKPKSEPLLLHREGLNFALECLNHLPEAQSELIRGALWECAIVQYIKCFSGSSADQP